jgi:biotin carboxyl carrier protein
VGELKREPDCIGRESVFVCIVEVMKTMNSIPAGASGEVIEVCSSNAEVVEHGAALFRVRAP